MLRGYEILCFLRSVNLSTLANLHRFIPMGKYNLKKWTKGKTSCQHSTYKFIRYIVEVMYPLSRKIYRYVVKKTTCTRINMKYLFYFIYCCDIFKICLSHKICFYMYLLWSKKVFVFNCKCFITEHLTPSN